MRVLHVYRTYLPDTQGGLEETIRQICRSTAALGVETRVFCLSKTPDPAIIERAETTVFRVQQTIEIASCGISVEGLFRFKQQAAWADVIHYHFPWPFADILHSTLASPPKSVLTYHSDIVRQRFLCALYRPLMNRFLRAMDRIVCTSPNYFTTSDILHHYESKLDIIPIGLDPATYPTPSLEEASKVQERFGSAYFLFIGVLRYYKGLHILLEAAADQSFRVVIAGSGPTEKALKKQAHALGLTNVQFAGFVTNTEKVAMIQHSRGIVFPSYLRAEAFGVTLLEGAMYGRPLISAEVGTGTSHVNKAEETGLVVPPGSALELRKAMQLLQNNGELAEKLGARAKERFQELFTAEEMGRRYNDVYLSLFAEATVS